VKAPLEFHQIDEWIGVVLEPTTAATTEIATRSATIAFLRLIDLERTTAEVFAIQRLHGAGGIGIRHFDEAEAAWAAGFAIVHQGHLVDGAVGSKEGAHLVFGGGERKITNVKFRHKTTHKKRNTVTGIQPCRLWFAEYFEVPAPANAGWYLQKNQQAGAHGTGFAVPARPLTEDFFA
jgi:hypothetical protein